MTIKNMLGTRTVIIEDLSSYMNTCLLQIKKTNGKGIKVKRRKDQRKRNKYQSLIII